MNQERRDFRYRREDFGALPVKLHHLTLYLNFTTGRVEVVNCLEMTALRALEELELDAAELEVVKVVWPLKPSSAHFPVTEGLRLEHIHDRTRNKLLVILPHRVQEGERFHITTQTHCIPSDHILEGIYKDATPPGCPQQYMSQCQQWGFQRIAPILDDCRAKCTMTTTLEAEAGYTHLISNGNISRKTNPDGKPVPKPGDPARQIITFENSVPMAPYLFIACAGTWDALVDHVTYPSGKRVRLEYLVPPGSVEGARIPMEILKDSVLWVAATQDYEYTGDTYRTITMNKSNFGGMENVGNTTIVTDAALIDEHTLDQSLLYAHAVIVHEFEHNQCGSETTMETPFDVWLNEAYTVDVERQYMAGRFDPSFIRLQQVESIRNPLLGPLALEDAGHVGRIVREGFNDPDELIDGVTYVKAAEVIRMLRLVLGEERFKAGKSLYFSRYQHGNANTDQFFQCFEEVSGQNLEQFKKHWLHTIGYPKVTAHCEYDAAAKEFRIALTQDLAPGQAPFHLPIEMSLVDHQGKDLAGTGRVVQLKDLHAQVVFDRLDSAPAFPSLNRDSSFYGTFRNASATRDELVLQTRLDPNRYNRVDAMRQLTDVERVRLLNNPDAEVDPQWLELYDEILADRDSSTSLRAFFLRIDEQPLDRAYCTWYPELVLAREKLMKAVNAACRDRLLQEFSALDTYTAKAGFSITEGIEARMLKQVLLDLIVVDDSRESHDLILDHFRRATTANDRVAALLALNRSSSPERRSLLEEVYNSWHGHLSAYANYLRVIASGTREDVFEMIERESRRSTFDITQPTWCRALFLPMALNNKKVWTEEGIQWVTDTVVKLAPINGTTASRLLNTFQHVGRLRADLQARVTKALENIVAQVPPEVSATIHGQARAYLKL